ncbi:hypothetical protein MMC10_008624 [Thelotrema lepadinum]|nr:hypothetical protein [Thelotrema lepadinum]
MDIEEKKLRKAPENPFESRVGAFWHLYWTRDYMKARYGLVEALMRIHTRLSVELQLDHRLEMFKLSRRDYLAVRFTIPSLMMRLGQDQECYDFVQLQAWNPEGLVEDEENKDMPWLSAANKDSFESVEFMCHASPPLECAVHVTLLKIRLLFDLMALRDSEAPAISGNVPRELLDIIQGYALHTNVVLKNQRILQLGNQSGLITTLCEQIRILWRVVRDADVDFWPILLAHGEYLRVGWYRYLRRDMTQAEITLQDSYRGWIETPGAIEVIKNLENDGKIKGETLYPCCCPAPWNAIDEHE